MRPLIMPLNNNDNPAPNLKPEARGDFGNFDWPFEVFFVQARMSLSLFNWVRSLGKSTRKAERRDNLGASVDSRHHPKMNKRIIPILPSIAERYRFFYLKLILSTYAILRIPVSFLEGFSLSSRWTWDSGSTNSGGVNNGLRQSRSS